MTIVAIWWNVQDLKWHCRRMGFFDDVFREVEGRVVGDDRMRRLSQIDGIFAMS